VTAAPERLYAYENAAGAPVLEVARFPGKQFRQRDPRNEPGEWGLRKDTLRPLYRLPRILQHIAEGRREPIFVVEGEKDVESLEVLGFAATCSPMGAGKWRDEHAEALQGAREVVVLADDDEPGRAHARTVALSLQAIGVPTKLVELWPRGGDSKADASDWLAQAHDADRREQARRLLLQIAAEVPTYRDAESGEPEGSSGRAEFEVRTARDLCALPDPPVADILLGPLLVRRCRTIVAGGTGEGKTSFSLRMIAAVVNGTEFLSWTGAGGRVLVLDLEQGLRTVKKRLREVGLADSDRVDYIRVPDGLALDSDTSQQEQLEQILQVGGYAVVLLDPFYKAHRGDSLDERAIVDLMRLLDRWREEYAFALLVPAHTRKKLEPSAKLTIDDVFGSSAIVRGAETVAGIQRIASGFSRLHWFKDRDGDDEIELGGYWNLLFDRETGYQRDPKDTAPPRDLAAEIEAHLIEHPGSTTNQIRTAVTAGKDRVSKLLKEDNRFTYEAGPNNARHWVVRSPQNHPDHQSSREGMSGGPTGGLSIESHPKTTHHPSGSGDQDHAHPTHLTVDFSRSDDASASAAKRDSSMPEVGS
jgi:hypothetical protein